MRSTAEWIGKTPDSQVPDRVRLRVWDSNAGVCQCGCRRKIRPGELWQTDHTKAIINGGENRESNLRTVLTEHHKNKTADDVAEKAVTYRKRKANLGIKKLRTITRWRRMDGTPVYATRQR